MTYNETLMGFAGFVGSCASIGHGILLQRLMVKPLGDQLADKAMLSPSLRRLVAPLLQFTTFAWLLGGLALVVVAWRSTAEVQLATTLLVSPMYIYGVITNFWATRGRHYGWALFAVASGMNLLSLAS